MNLSLVYLAHQFTYRITDFLRHWYIGSSKRYWHAVIERLEHLDYYLAWNITRKHLFQPLYGDYSIIGYVLGFVFRIGRLFIASIVYTVVFLIAVGIYLLWFLIPPLLILKTITG